MAEADEGGHLMMKHHVYNASEKVADVAAATTITGAGWSWISTANEILTLVATIVAIAVGIATLVFHVKRIKQMKD